ncbi:hypothetical protein BRL53_07650 [Corynebacterium ulcerans]|nr:hypothetical protein BRL53_07650 [Corynebacterium ulcerans]
MGRRGDKKAAECWKADPHGEYALAERKRLAETNKRRTAGGKSTAFKLRFSLLIRLAKQGSIWALPMRWKNLAYLEPRLSVR